MKRCAFGLWIPAVLALTIAANAAERLVYLDAKDTSLWVEDINSGNKRLVAPSLKVQVQSSVDVSPDGRYAAVWRDDQQLAVVKLDAPNQVRYFGDSDVFMLTIGPQSGIYEYLGWADQPDEFYISRCTNKGNDAGVLILDVSTGKVRPFLHGDPGRSQIRRVYRCFGGSRLVLEGYNWIDIRDGKTLQRLCYETDPHRNPMDVTLVDADTAIFRHLPDPEWGGLPKEPFIVDLKAGKRKSWPFPKFDLRKSRFCDFDRVHNVLVAADGGRRELDMKSGQIRVTQESHLPWWYTELNIPGYRIVYSLGEGSLQDSLHNNATIATGKLSIVDTTTGGTRVVSSQCDAYALWSDAPSGDHPIPGNANYWPH